DETDPDYPTGYVQTEGDDPTHVTTVVGADTDAGNDGYYICIQPPVPPSDNCWDNYVFNDTTCQWDNTGTQPTEPTPVNCWDNYVFNDTTCQWDNTGTQPTEPTPVNCWDNYVFNDTTCQWENQGITTTNVNDADCDGVPADIDCDDSDPTVTDSLVDDDDGDGVPNCQDICPGFDDAVDTNNNGIPDGCELDLEVTKDVNVDEATIGDEVEFTITITNHGSFSATNVIVEEILPSGYNYISYTATSGTFDNVIGQWTISEILSGEAETLSIIVEVLNVTDYENTATLIGVDQNDSNPNNNSDSATIGTVLEADDCLTVFNEFSPNGDGVNDTFVIQCIEDYPNNTLEVYNRWGNLVYKSNGYLNDWDGTSNGRAVINQSDKLPVGTYYYIFTYEKDGITNSKVGWLYINR
ncbi:gliding motility-associated C-terminal domain-containing protein, partial [Snuella lapsa]|uniref:T9SS type B sorting domain-containing protein n=1 Tax=Snuella lapsa TaxID=870481 RepID=UPI0031EA47CA